MKYVLNLSPWLRPHPWNTSSSIRGGGGQWVLGVWPQNCLLLLSPSRPDASVKPGVIIKIFLPFAYRRTPPAPEKKKTGKLSPGDIWNQCPLWTKKYGDFVQDPLNVHMGKTFGVGLFPRTLSLSCTLMDMLGLRSEFKKETQQTGMFINVLAGVTKMTDRNTLGHA